MLRILDWHRTGSSFTCDPPVQDTDYDVLYLVAELPTREVMQEAGWTKCELNSGTPLHYSRDPGYDVTWTSYRMGPTNAILITDKAFYLKFVAATLLAKHLNLKEKGDRVALYRFIKNSEPYNGPFKASK